MRIADRIEHDARPETRAVLANAQALRLVLALAGRGFQRLLRQAGGAILLGEEPAEMLADDLARRDSP